MAPSSLDPRRWRVGAKIAIAIVVLAIVPAVILTQLAVDRLQQQAEADGGRSLRSLAESIATSLDAEINANLQLVSAIALDERVVAFATGSVDDRTTLQPQVDRLMDNMKATHPDAGIFFVLDADGVAITSSDRAILGLSYDFRTYFQRAIVGEINVSDVYVPIGTTSPVPGTAFAAPIMSDGRVVGVATIKSDALTVSDALSTPDGLAPFIMESSGILSSYPDERVRLSSVKPLDAATQAQAVAAKRFDGPVPVIESSADVQAIAGSDAAGFTVGDIGDDLFAIAWHPLSSVDWVAGVSEPHERYAAAANRARNDALVRAAIVLAVALGIALFAARMLTKPLRVLTETARRLAAGSDGDESLDVELDGVARRRDDLGVLGARLSSAAKETRERERKLKDLVASLRVEIDHARKDADVAEIVEGQFFTDLKSRADSIRARPDHEE